MPGLLQVGCCMRILPYQAFPGLDCKPIPFHTKRGTSKSSLFGFVMKFELFIPWWLESRDLADIVELS